MKKYVAMMVAIFSLMIIGSTAECYTSDYCDGSLLYWCECKPNQYYQPILLINDFMCTEWCDPIIDSDGFVKEQILPYVHPLLSGNCVITEMDVNQSRIVMIVEEEEKCRIRVAKWRNDDYCIIQSTLFPLPVYLSSSPLNEDCFYMQLMSDPNEDGRDVLFLVFRIDSNSSKWQLDYYTDAYSFVAFYTDGQIEIRDYETKRMLLRSPFDGLLEDIDWLRLYEVLKFDR